MNVVIWVVKLGGSLIDSPYLRGWLELLSARGGGRVVIVPGGGPFADAVRAAQARWHFDDAAAHQMALLAMDLYGRLLLSLSRKLQPGASIPELRQALLSERVPVWLPARMLTGNAGEPGAGATAPAAESAGSGDSGVLQSWDMTSDSLALWLAGRLRAKRVVLVKRPAPDLAAISAQECVRRGVVDVAFPSLLSRWSVEARWVGAAQLDAFADSLVAENKTAGAAITAQDVPELEAAAG